MFINDVGQNTWEEINDGIAGANYGWPDTEGPTTDPRFDESDDMRTTTAGGVCAITGGAFYSPLTAQFPSDYSQRLFLRRLLRRLDSQARSRAAAASSRLRDRDFVSRRSEGVRRWQPVLPRARIGAATGVVYRIVRTRRRPSRRTPPAGPSSRAPRSRSACARRVRRCCDISGSATASTSRERRRRTTRSPSVGQADNGARFRAMVSNDFGNVLSNEAVLTVTANQAPTGTISQPAAGTLYSGGSVITYAGPRPIRRTGRCRRARSRGGWTSITTPTRIRSSRPRPARPAVRSRFPRAGETSANVWYRIYLTVRDSGGLTHTTQRDILPRKVRLTLATNPAGLQLKLDGQPVATPFSFDSVVGIVRNIEATTPQASGGRRMSSCRGRTAAPRADISTPAANTTYTATFRANTDGSVHGLSATYFDKSDLHRCRIAGVIRRWTSSGTPARRRRGIAADTFSVRWTGQVEAPVTGTYTFYTAQRRRRPVCG